MQVREFQTRLRKLGFKCDYRDKSVQNYICEFPEHKSKVEVQLWDDGKHRVSHFHHSITPYGIMDSFPTDFRTIEGMLKAIEFEKTRFLKGVSRDHKEKVEIDQ